MIRLINLKNVASYKSNATLETDKKINLIYGLNGAGKSTFSNFLHQRIDPKYKDCSIDGLEDDHEVLVYNQAFIQENFFEVENLKGIFTLSKENKEAETKISNALKEIKKIQDEIGKQKSELEDEKRTIVQE
ncbi:AAA family ATPase [Acinetobacter lactucae]|nr:AAA family ATPase [Acinetobacter lactucae]